MSHIARGDEMTHNTMKTLGAQVAQLAEDGYRRRREADVARITGTPRERIRKAVPARRRWPAPVLAGTAAAAVAVGIVAIPSGHRSDRESALPDARSFLLASADITAKTPAAAPERYWYSQIRVIERARKAGGVKSHGTSANGAPRNGPLYPFHANVSITWENWDPYRQGDTRRTVDRDITTAFASPADKAAWRQAGSPTLTDMKPYTADERLGEPYLELGPNGTRMADLAKLPTTPGALKTMIFRDWSAQRKKLQALHAKNDGLSFAEYLYDTALTIINAPVTPQTRAAAFRMLSAEPGFRVIGRVRDRLGRSGVAIAYSGGLRQGVEERVIIEPGSARILATERHKVDGRGKTESEPFTSTLMIREGWTDRLGVPAEG